VPLSADKLQIRVEVPAHHQKVELDRVVRNRALPLEVKQQILAVERVERVQRVVRVQSVKAVKRQARMSADKPLTLVEAMAAVEAVAEMVAVTSLPGP
jgi:hypothetical protein